MTVKPREVEVRIVKRTSEDNTQDTIDDTNFKVAMNKFPEALSTFARRVFRRKGRWRWEPLQPCVHMVSSTIPAVLHTCREARNHGLYQQVSLDADNSHGAGRRYVWLNLDIDFLDIREFLMVYFKPIAATVKRLKLSRANWNPWWCSIEMNEVDNFINVEEIRVVCLDGFSNWGCSFRDSPWPCTYESLAFINEKGDECVDHIGVRRKYRMMLRQDRLLLNCDDWSTDEESLD
ncbi:hypothetical protein IQ07DRAFT_646167 [Pyrenochaeta sp. DS3sAY3a]|nr:hypothetical protein IQ07DRAFT_646167 [Pyrenochaeta sp. DS3sAY3a]